MPRAVDYYWPRGSGKWSLIGFLRRRWYDLTHLRYTWTYLQLRYFTRWEETPDETE